MSPDRQRAVIAELCGFFPTPWGTWTKSPNGLNGPFLDLPDYLNDLNAIHEALITILKTQADWISFEQSLKWVMVKAGRWPNLDIPSWALLSAEADHLCEALIRTLNKWEDAK